MFRQQDQTHSIGALLEWWFNALLRGGVVIEHIYPEGLHFRLGLTALGNFQQTVSLDEPLIQAADLLAALMAAMLQRHAEFRETNPGLVYIYSGIAAGALQPGPIPARFLGSQSFFSAALAPLSDAIQWANSGADFT